MPRPRSIPLGLVAQVAALAMLTGCGDDHRVVEAQRCLDISDWMVVPDNRCDQQQTEGRTRTGSAGGGRYFWHYGGQGYNVGDRPTGGSPVPSSSVRQVRVNSGGHLGGSSVRGGFGSSGVHASGAS